MSMEEGFITVLGCRMCGKCGNICPYFALHRAGGKAMVEHDRCELCMRCVESCPNKALVYME